MVDQPNQKAQNDALENLALRFQYGELNARNKDIADRVTALIIAYPDIVKLQDPKQQQDMIDRIRNSKSGEEIETALKEVGALTSELGKSTLKLLRGIDPTGSVDAAQSSAENLKSAAGIVSAFFKGPGIAASPFTVPAAGAGELYNQMKVLWTDMTPEKARMVGTMYASTMQSREKEREGKTAWGAFTSVSSFWAVVKALVATIPNWIANISPDAGKWVADLFGGSHTRTLAENLNRQFTEADITTVREEMTKAGQKDYAAALTEKTVLQGPNGVDVETTPPSADNPAPDVKGAKKDSKGQIVPPKPDAAGVLTDAKDKSGAKIKEKAKELTSGIDTPGEKLAAAGGTAVAAVAGGTVAVGAAEGLVRGVMLRPQRVADAAEVRMKALDAKATAATNPQKATHFSQAANRAAAEGLVRGGVAAQVESRVAAMASSESKLVSATGKFLEGALGEPAKGQSFLRRWPRAIAERTGALATVVAEKAVGAVDKIASIAERGVTGAFKTANMGEAMTSVAKNGAGFVARNAGKVALPVMTAMETNDLIDGIETSNHRKTVVAVNTLGTIAGFAGAGFLVGGPPGAIALGGIGALVSPFMGMISGKIFDHSSTNKNITPTPPADKPASVSAADRGLEAAAIDAMLNAERARLAAVAAQSPEAMVKARMAANRGLAFANVRSAEPVGVVRLQEGLPMGSTVASANLSASPAA